MFQRREMSRTRSAPPPSALRVSCHGHCTKTSNTAWDRLATRAPDNERNARSKHLCPECEEEERRREELPAHHQQTNGGGSGGTGVASIATAPSRPTSEDVWGFLVTRSMCGCKQQVRDGIAWANEARETYAKCDTPTNATGTDVEACFDAAQPGSTVEATTSESGVITLPPPSSDSCQRIEDKVTLVHETMHARRADVMARARGTAFFREWQKLAGDPNRLDTLRPKFPAEVAVFEAQWNNGHDWAQDEVNSYRWERRFLEDALQALNRIC